MRQFGAGGRLTRYSYYVGNVLTLRMATLCNCRDIIDRAVYMNVMVVGGLQAMCMIPLCYIVMIALCVRNVISVQNDT
jgi:hypothetical protein